MKTILASIIMMATVLSGCTTVVMTESYEARPTTIVTEAYRSCMAMLMSIVMAILASESKK